MVVKFCYQGEIHRISELPADLAALKRHLVDSFKSNLPENFDLFYNAVLQDEETAVRSQEDYDILRNIEAAKTIKVFIRGQEEQAVDVESYHVINEENRGKRAESDDFDQIKEQEQEKPKKGHMALENIVQELSESIIVPKINKKLEEVQPEDALKQEKQNAYFSYSYQQDEHIKKLVRETIREQLPFIISEVKAVVIAEVRANIPKVQPAQPARPRIASMEEPEEKKEAEPAWIQYEEADSKVNENIELEVANGKGEKQGLLNKVKKLGTAVKDQLEDWSHKVSGDPLIVVPEGKYSKSIVDKADKLREIFTDQERKTLMDFIKKYPKEATLAQLAHAFLAKDEPPRIEENEQAEPEVVDANRNDI